MYHPPDYIDNTSSERRLVDVLNALLLDWGETELDVASGFFEPRIWEMLSEGLSALECFRLLLGRPPEIENSDTDDGVIDLRQFYQEKLRQDVEKLPTNRGYAHMIDQLNAFLLRDEVQVRYYNGQFLHAKAYLTPNAAIVGSSNFTPSGMTRRAELNLVQRTKSTVRDLRENWFDAMWAESDDHKADLIAALTQSKFGDAPWTPHQIFMKVLFEYFRERITPEDMEARIGVELASFQQEGLRDAIRLIDRHGGVIVSDAVGLGKTYIGMGLLEHYLLGKRKRGHIPRGLVICPAQLRDLVWEPKLDEYGIKADVVSQEMISREDIDLYRYNRYDVILVDESHNFRNPGTNRHQNLMKMLATGGVDTKLILMTATPVNNSVWDMYHQVSFITRGYDTYFRDYGIRNLKGFFQSVSDGGDIFPLLEQVMVRRSRLDVKRRQEAGEEIRLPGKGIIEFPKRHLHSVNYDLTGTYDGFYAEIVSLIESLELISFNIEEYRKGEINREIEQRRQFSTALIGILKTLYLKRLESSLEAFRISIERQREFQNRFFSMLMEGKLLDSATNRKLLALEALEDDPSAEAKIETIIAQLPEADITVYNTRAMRDALKQDRHILDLILDKLALVQVADSVQKRDAKLSEVKALLGGKLRGQKILLFSYYRDTAQYVYEQLQADLSWANNWEQPPVVEVIHGGTDPHRRENLVLRFAPQANSSEDRPTPISHDQPEVDILISTDVLSEGQNLQDAGVIINYDLHWTPIRMIQRAGRIDRLGTNFADLAIYNCFPQTGLEDLLRLVERLQDRIRDIDSTVGLDASILGETISARSLEQLKRLSEEDERVLDELEKELELASTDEMRLPLLFYLQQQGMADIQRIPLGVGSGIAHSTSRPTGVFLAFRAYDRHFWRLYTTDEDGSSLVITDKRRLYRWIQVPPDEQRVIPANFEIYDILEQATTDILKELTTAERAKRVPRKLGKIAQELQIALQQVPLGAEPIPDAQREKLLNVIRNAALEAFKRDRNLKVILNRFKAMGNQHTLADELDSFFVENDLYREMVPIKSTSQQIREEDLHLVAYEVFG